MPKPHPAYPSHLQPADIARAIAYARQRANLLCLWRLCGQRRCLRARACRCDPHDCLPSILLLPPEVQDFIIGFEDAMDERLYFDEMLEEHEAEWLALEEWRELVFATLPVRRCG
jgi:hypothetical protein